MNRLPIRIRVALLAATAGLLASFAAAAVATWRTDSLATRDLDDFLSLEASELVALISFGGDFSTLVDINPSMGPTQHIALFDQDGEVVDSTLTPPPTPDLTNRSSRYVNVVEPDTGEPLRMIVIPMDMDGQPHLLALATSAQFVSDRVGETARAMIPLVLIAVAAVALGSYVITGFALKPVASLTESAREFAQSPSGRRLVVPEADDEISSLAITLNTALDRIDQVMRQHREFVAQASHELRAPLSRLVADLEYASRPTRSSEEVSTGLASLSGHTKDMMRVADELLDLLEDRVDQGPQTAPLTMVIEDVLGHVSHYSELRSDVSCMAGEAVVHCNPGQIGGAVRNLVDNAFEHGSQPVALAIECSDQNIEFRVTDAGPGIPESLRPSIGKPFTRGDGAGRAGLGLAIVSRVAARVGGELELQIEPMSCAILRIPIF